MIVTITVMFSTYWLNNGRKNCQVVIRMAIRKDKEKCINLTIILKSITYVI